MQLPGMSTDPVRVSLEVTWWPGGDDFSLSTRVWTRPTRNDVWQLEEMAVSGTPILLSDLEDRWTVAALSALAYIERVADPFDSAGTLRRL